MTTRRPSFAPIFYGLFIAVPLYWLLVMSLKTNAEIAGSFALIPLALRGVKFRAEGAGQMLRRNMLIYGVGGIMLPFAGIKLIDLLLVAMNLA